MAADAVAIHDSSSSNIADTVQVITGDPEAAFAGADRVLERRFSTPRQKQCQIEPTGCLVIPTPDGRIDVWTPHQAPHRARSTLAHLFAIPESRLRVVTPEIGGAFGKNDALTAEPYAMALSLVTERPVRLVFDRSEDFVGTESRHPMVADVFIALSPDGMITGLRAIWPGRLRRLPEPQPAGSEGHRQPVPPDVRHPERTHRGDRCVHQHPGRGRVPRLRRTAVGVSRSNT